MKSTNNEGTFDDSNPDMNKSKKFKLVLLNKSRMSELDIATNMEHTGRYKEGDAKTWTQDQEDEGTAVEAEHSDNPEIARQIAMDHLVEDADYYTKLKRMEADK